MMLSPRLLDLLPRDGHVPADIPRVGLVISTFLSLSTISVLAVALTRRIDGTRNWTNVPPAKWLILAIYGDSIIFIFTSAMLEHGFGLNTSIAICDTAILLCLVCYMSTKLIYYFLVEKVYIIRSVSTPRLRSKLYCFNCFGMLLPYTIVVALNFIYRTAYFTPEGTCIIGMQLKVMLPLIIFDAAVNIYLTLLFVIPLRSLYSYRHSSPASTKARTTLQTAALRSLVGSLGTLSSSVVNLSILMVLGGEPAWVCLMCCNADILFSVLVLQWVTGTDGQNTKSSGRSQPTQTQIPSSERNCELSKTSGERSSDRAHTSVTLGASKSLDDLALSYGVVTTTHISALPVPLSSKHSFSKPFQNPYNEAASSEAPKEDGIRVEVEIAKRRSTVSQSETEEIRFEDFELFVLHERESRQDLVERNV